MMLDNIQLCVANHFMVGHFHGWFHVRRSLCENVVTLSAIVRHVSDETSPFDTNVPNDLSKATTSLNQGVPHIAASTDK